MSLLEESSVILLDNPQFLAKYYKSLKQLYLRTLF